MQLFVVLYNMCLQRWHCQMLMAAIFHVVKDPPLPGRKLLGKCVTTTNCEVSHHYFCLLGASLAIYAVYNQSVAFERLVVSRLFFFSAVP